MARHYVIKIDSDVKINGNFTPIINVNNVDYFIMTDELVKAIGDQIVMNTQGKSCYSLVGYIDNGKMNFNDKTNKISFNAYDYRQFLWED